MKSKEPKPLPWPFPVWGHNEHGKWVMQPTTVPVKRESKTEKMQRLIDEVGEAKQ